MTNDDITLEEYAECVQKCLENVTYDHQMSEDMKPLVIYATAPIAFAKAQERFANGQNVGPLITFYQSGIEVDHGVQMGAWKYMPVQRDEGNYLFKAPIICDINYTVTISALTERQADLLQVQIMQATPFHRPYYTKYNGNFVCIENTETSNLSSVDVGDNKDKFSQRQLTLKIQRAYLHYDIKELNAGIIRPYRNKQEKTFIEQQQAEAKAIAMGMPGDAAKFINEQEEEKQIEQSLTNGAVIYEDKTVGNGVEVKNTSADGYAPFNYNVLDENGNVIDVVQKGRVKVKIYSIEKVK